ncbi:hypothetical protein Leryth_018527 [Lithospermum erythrorhizon]|nr:hypothetical protein Leryth_018527 [Lithospermum erythrorhizon]
MVTTFSVEKTQNLQISKNNYQHGGGFVVDEIPGLLKVYHNGHVERPQIVPNVPPNVPSELGIISRDIVIQSSSNIWARIYLPTQRRANKLPLLVYFHGGGFCVGSASWKCYHDFLAELASKSGCVIMSVNYRLAPENRLPAAYEDGINVVMWLNNQARNGCSGEHNWWLSHCTLSSIFLAGDSAGANIAYHVATRLESNPKAIRAKGIILIQPFTGGETRTNSEKQSIQPYYSALTLSASDAYWRLALPPGADRDHPWCNPLSRLTRLPRAMICISELDIMRDRNLDFCAALASSGTKVEKVVFQGVGHAFQILHNYPLSQQRTQQMMHYLKVFINS